MNNLLLVNTLNKETQKLLSEYLIRIVAILLQLMLLIYRLFQLV